MWATRGRDWGRMVRSTSTRHMVYFSRQFILCRGVSNKKFELLLLPWELVIGLMFGSFGLSRYAAYNNAPP